MYGVFKLLNISYKKGMKKNKVKLFLCLCVLLGIIGGVIYFICTTKQEDKQGEIDVKYEKMNMITNFRLGIAKYDSINPHITQNKDVIQIASLIFEPLLTITQDYRVENCLAKEWSKVSNKSYIIKLKENVKWQDNSDFTAEDVKFTIEEIKNAGIEDYYSEHGISIYPVNASGSPFTITYVAVTGDVIADLSEDMAAEQKARAVYEHLIDLADDEEVVQPLLFLRQREIVHFNRFKELYDKYKEMGY